MSNNLDINLAIRATNSGASSAIRGIESDVSRLKATGEKVTKAFKTTGQAIDFLNDNLGSMMASESVADFFVGAVSGASSFEDKVAEVNTLLTGSFIGTMDDLTEAAKDQAAEFGNFPADQAQAQYQIISAGATSAAQANDILYSSNMLAVAGITEVETAASALGTIMNVYGEEAGTASEISDAMFVAMQNGVTTVDQLASSIGGVAPMAQAAGLSVDEMLSGVAALTKGGLSTSEAVTTLKGVLAAVIKPTKEASDTAKALGIEFSASALESKGLAGFMEHLKEKTGGNVEAMNKLFGGVEAATGAISFMGGAGEALNSTLDAMESKNGKVSAGFDVISETSGFKYKQTVAEIRVQMEDWGSTILNSFAPAIDLVGDNMDELMIAGSGAVKALGGIAVIKDFSPQLVTFAAAVKGAGTSLALLAGPIAIAVAGLAALGVAIYKAHQAGEDLKEQYDQGLTDHFNADKALSTFDGLKDKIDETKEAMEALRKEGKEGGDQWNNLNNKLQAYERTQNALMEGSLNAAEALEEETNKLGDTAAASEAAKKAGEDLATAMEEQRQKAGELISKLGDSTTAKKDEKTATDELRAGTDEYKEALQDLMDELNPFDALAAEVKNKIDLLALALGEGDISQDEFREGVVELQNQLNEFNEKAGKDAPEQVNVYATAWEEGLKRVDNAMSEAFHEGLDNFKNFGDSMLDALEYTLKEMAYQWTRSQFIQMIGGQGQSFSFTGSLGSAMGNYFGVNPFSGTGGGSVGIGGTPAGGGLGGFGGFGGIANTLSGIGTSLGNFANTAAAWFSGAGGQQASMLAAQTAEFGLQGAQATSQALGGFGSGSGLGSYAGTALGALGGGFMGYQIGSMTSDLFGGVGTDASVGGAAGGTIGAIVGGPIGSAIGSALGSALGSAIGFGSRELTNTGVALEYDGSSGDLTGDAFKNYKKKKWGKTRRSTSWSEMDAELEASLDAAMDSYEAAIFTMAENFGRTEESIREAVAEFSVESGKIKFGSLSPEEITAKLQDWVDEAGGELLKAVMPEFDYAISAAGDQASEMVAPLLSISQYVNTSWAPEVYSSLTEAVNASYLTTLEAIKGYEAGVQNTQDLSVVLQQRLAVEQQMLLAVQTAGTNITQAIDAQRTRLYQMTTSAEDQMADLIEKSEVMASMLHNAADPKEINDLGVQIAQNMGMVMSMMGEEQLMASKDEIEKFLIGVQEISDQRLKAIEDATKDQHDELATSTVTMLKTGEESLVFAGDALIDSASLIADAAADSNLAAGNLNVSAESLNNAAAAILQVVRTIASDNGILSAG